MTSYKHLVLASLISTVVLAGASYALNTETPASTMPIQAPSQVDDFYRLLPLQGGSNFRDLGGYKTESGTRIKPGLLFRSGSPASLTAVDEAYLNDMGFKAVFDLRSNEEIDLYPNQWVANTNGKIAYHTQNYSMESLMKAFSATNAKASFGPDQMAEGYKTIHKQLKPLLSSYFNNLILGNAPVMFNCSAGKDRTGITGGLLLSALGVDRETIMKDYLLSNAYRRPSMEKGNVDYAAKADTNFFAKLMVRHAGKEAPLQTDTLTDSKGTPFLTYTFAAIEAEYGSVNAYLEKEFGLNEKALTTLRAMYTH